MFPPRLIDRSTAALLVLSGALPRWGNPFVGAVLVAVGGAVGLVPTAWTVVIPLFIIGVISLTLIDAGLTADARKAQHVEGAQGKGVSRAHHADNGRAAQ